MNASAEHNDARELERLVRFMTRKGRRFGLALATYADAEFAANRRRQANERASDAGVRVTMVRLPDISDDPVGQLAVESTTTDIIHLVDLDDIAFDREGRRTATSVLRDLNFRRDALPEQVDARIVVWIAAEAYPQMAKLAWDLLDVMLTRFEFRSERDAASPRTWKPALRLDEPIDDSSSLAQSAEAHARMAASASDPKTKADAYATAGSMYARAGRLEPAIEQLERAASLYERLVGDRLHGVRLAVAARLELAKALWRKGEERPAQAEIVGALELADSALVDAERQDLNRWTLEARRLECLWAQMVFAGATIPEPSGAAATADDLELLERWRSGDPAALRTFFARQLPTIVGFLRRLAPNQVDETLIAPIFMGMWELPPPPAEADFRATLFEVARSVVRSRRPTWTWVEAAAPSPPLQASLEQLRPELRELIEMHYQFGVPVGELAEMLGVVEPTLQYRLSAAIHELLARHTERTGEQLTEQTLRAALNTGQHQHTMAR